MVGVGLGEGDCRISVVVSSVGRPECLRYLVGRLNAQTLLPRRILLVVAQPDDAPLAEDLPPDLKLEPEVLISPKGLPHQRNRGLDAVVDSSDIVVFFDDDYVPSRTALKGIRSVFEKFPKVNGLTGVLIADGIRGPGFEPEEAGRRVDEWDAAADGAGVMAPRILPRRVGLYGCNMAYRASAVRHVRFDERLPLYAWQEDIDFSARVEGSLVKTDALTGVHCGLKRGRETTGHLLGYSQIANPVYLLRKGTISRSFAAKLCVRALLANHLRTLRPEPWVDRRARARGNWIAVLDLIQGRSDPARILDL